MPGKRHRLRIVLRRIKIAIRFSKFSLKSECAMFIVQIGIKIKVLAQYQHFNRYIINLLIFNFNNLVTFCLTELKNYFELMTKMTICKFMQFCEI